MSRLPIAAKAPHVGCLSLLYGCVLAVALVVGSGGDVSSLVHAGPPATDARRAPDSLTVDPAGGFDGQFYYRLAVSPLSTSERVNGVQIDSPALRSQRILYPVLSRLVAFGDDDRIPLALVVVNVLAVGAVGWLGAVLAIQLGRAPAWGLLFAAYPGFVYTLAFDLTELLASSLVLGGLVLVGRRRLLAAGIVFAAAALTRETNVVVPFGLGLVWAWSWLRPDDGERPPLLGAVPALLPGVVFVSWQLFLGSRFGQLPLQSDADANIRFPLAGLIEARSRFWPTSGENLFRDLSLGLLVLVVLLAAMTWRRSAAPLGIRVSWIVSVIVLLLLSENVYDGATSFMRGGVDSYLLGLLVILGSDRALTSLLVPSVTAVSGLTIASELAKAA